MRRRHRERGVTVLEILIVSAIIGIIALLSIPTYRSIMQKTRRTRMVAQMRMISDDESLYERDHGSFYPTGVQQGENIYAFQIIAPGDPLVLPGQGTTLPAHSRYYTYYIYRLDPTYPEPIIYAYAHQSYGNDLDGDVFPDMWIKIGSGPPQIYMDDMTDTVYSVPVPLD